jgi:hypothetical protein
MSAYTRRSGIIRITGIPERNNYQDQCDKDNNDKADQECWILEEGEQILNKNTPPTANMAMSKPHERLSRDQTGGKQDTNIFRTKVLGLIVFDVFWQPSP